VRDGLERPTRIVAPPELKAGEEVFEQHGVEDLSAAGEAAV
jgi:hypothetical protein